MNKFFIPWATLTLAALTYGYSSFIAFHLTGSLLGNVNISQLEAYGGVALKHIYAGEIWRLFTAQLLHAKAIHMLYNTAALVALGLVIEPRIGPWRFFLIWLIAGGLATLFSSLFGSPPWNLGTGASQATFALAAAALASCGRPPKARLLGTAGLALIPGLVLDLISAGHLKPGHTAGLLLGLACYWLVCPLPAANSLDKGDTA